MKRRVEGKGAVNRSKTMEDKSKSLKLVLQEEDVDKCLMIRPSTHVFECKTCNRSFTSFQALGGHRASHKKPRFTSGIDQISESKNSKVHECLICSLEFPSGQALGGHMRRHRNTGVNGVAPSPSVFLQVPQMKKNANIRRVLCVDLNLSPPENGLDVETGTGLSEKGSLPVFRQYFL